MNCENCFCVYENNGICILDNLSLDINGQCKECIYLTINDDDLQDLKEKSRLKLKNY